LTVEYLRLPHFNPMTAPSGPIHVLLVEDDDEYAGSVRAQLEAASAPMTLETVGTVAAAVAALEATEFDAVLLDLALPDGAGLATIDRLLGAGDASLIVLTSMDDESTAVQAVQRGAQDYLIKGRTDAELLRRAIRYACERAEWRRDVTRREAELRQSHKMEAIGRLAGGVAHDFNNVLTAIFGYADLLLDQFTDDDPRQADVLEIRNAAERAAALTRQLLAFSRKQMIQPKVLNLNDVVTSLHKLMSRLVGEDIPIDIRPARDLWGVRADPGQIEQVLMNLAANSRDAMPEGGSLTISTENTVVAEEDTHDRPGLRPGDYVTLIVADTGLGVPEDVRPHIFEPFFTTKALGKGTGLGLATVYGIVKQNGGGIYLESEDGKGTRFVIYLPRVPGTLTSFP
jgi:two-component system, cell cycle sensor histidine kinase and response regulator CckA